MADFFSRIAGRTLGVAPVVRPNIPPMFAPIPAIETSDELAAAPPGEVKTDFLPRQDQRRVYPDPPLTETPPLTRDESPRTTSPAPQISTSRVETQREADAPPSQISRPNSRVFNRKVPAAAAGATMSWDAPPRDSDAVRTVQVTIGRVEVRAITPAPQEPRRTERKAVPLSSLEEYLRERNGRRR